MLAATAPSLLLVKACPRAFRHHGVARVEPNHVPVEPAGVVVQCEHFLCPFEPQRQQSWQERSLVVGGVEVPGVLWVAVVTQSAEDLEHELFVEWLAGARVAGSAWGSGLHCLHRHIFASARHGHGALSNIALLPCTEEWFGARPLSRLHAFAGVPLWILVELLAQLLDRLRARMATSDLGDHLRNLCVLQIQVLQGRHFVERIDFGQGPWREIA